MMKQMPVVPNSGQDKPWEDSEFGRPPIGHTDHWLVRGEWMVRAHGKSRVQSYSPLHSRTPMPPGELLHDCVVVKFYGGRPEPVIQHRRWLWSVDKDKDHWRGYTFFQRKMTRSVGSSSEPAPTQLDPPTASEEPSAAVQSVREAMAVSAGSGSQSAHEPLMSARASHGGGYRQTGVVEKGRQAVERPLQLGKVGAEKDDRISDWSEVSSDLEEVPPHVRIHREGKHEAMPYIPAGVKGKYKGKIKGKIKGDADAEEVLREMQRVAEQEMRIERMERQEELYGPVRGEPESSSGSSYPTALAFREARFEKLEIEKLNFEAGSSVLKLLKFEPWKLHFKASRLCREAPKWSFQKLQNGASRSSKMELPEASKWSFQKLHFGASGLHTVTLKSFGGCLQTSSMSFFFY